MRLFVPVAVFAIFLAIFSVASADAGIEILSYVDTKCDFKEFLEKLESTKELEVFGLDVEKDGGDLWNIYSFNVNVNIRCNWMPKYVSKSDVKRYSKSVDFNFPSYDPNVRIGRTETEFIFILDEFYYSYSVESRSDTSSSQTDKKKIPLWTKAFLLSDARGDIFRGKGCEAGTRLFNLAPGTPISIAARVRIVRDRSVLDGNFVAIRIHLQSVKIGDEIITLAPPLSVEDSIYPGEMSCN